MDVMKIEEIVGDVILVILDNYEPLKKIGIENDKFFVRVKGYDEYGLWIYQPKFTVPKMSSNKKNETQNVEASAGAGSIIEMPEDMDGNLKPYIIQPSCH